MEETITVPIDEYRELIATKALSKFVISAAEKEAKDATNQCQNLKIKVARLEEENETLKARLYSLLEENIELKKAGAGEEYEPI